MKFKAPKVYIVPMDGEADGVCTQCGKFEELRPYGKDGAKICFACGMKDKELTGKMFEKQFK
jgi:hypothetical protein